MLSRQGVVQVIGIDHGGVVEAFVSHCQRCRWCLAANYWPLAVWKSGSNLECKRKQTQMPICRGQQLEMWLFVVTKKIVRTYSLTLKMLSNNWMRPERPLFTVPDARAGSISSTSFGTTALADARFGNWYWAATDPWLRTCVCAKAPEYSSMKCVTTVTTINQTTRSIM